MVTVSNLEHVKNQGVTCPLCGSYNIKGAAFEADGGVITQAIGCDDCDAAWTDIFTLSGICEVTDKNGNDVIVTFE